MTGLGTLRCNSPAKPTGIYWPPDAGSPGGKVSKINPFRQRECIVKVYAEVPNRAVHLGMTEQ
jgi:hypothetical protein